MLPAAVFPLLTALALTVTARAGNYEPAWAGIAPLKTIALSPAPADSPALRGAALVKAVAALQPGEGLTLAAGTYSVERMWDVQVSGTEKAPVWITAEKNAAVIITRPDAQQNTVNIGRGKPVALLCLRALEITGGSHGLRLGRCSRLRK